MRAILIKNDRGPVENLYIGETPRPVPQSNEVLVKIRAFGLNRGDLSQREGLYPIPAGSTSTLGVEFSGTIIEVGEDVSQWKVDDEVMGLTAGGAYAEYRAVPQTHVVRKPSHLSWAEAASIPEVFLTALQGVVMYAEIKKNDDVLVHAGASGVGIAAIQLARIYGANTVTATASTQDKLDWLLSIPNGATNVVNYKTQNFAEEVKKITDSKGADIVIDFAGQSHLERNIEALAVDGRMSMLGLLSGDTVPSFSLAPILYKRLRIQGSNLRLRSVSYQADLIARFEREILPNITGQDGNGPIRSYHHKVYPWTEIQEAHREMAANKNIGKIIAEILD